MTRQSLVHLYRELWRLAEGSRRTLLISMLLLVGSQLIRLAVPALSGHAIDALQLNGLPGLGEAGKWLALVFVATLGSWALHGPGRILERNVALKVRQRLSGEMVGKLLSLPLAWHESQHSGATMHRVEQSSRALYDFAQTQFIYLQQAMGLVGPVIALWLIEPLVGAAALLGLLLISFSLSGFDRAMIRLALKENDAERRYTSTLIDSIANITSVFALRQTRAVAALVQRRLQAIYVPLRRMILVNEAKWCAVDVFSQALSCGLLALFAYLAARGLSQAAPVAANVAPSPTLPLGNIYMVWQYALQAGGVISGIASHFQTFARQQADYAAGEPIRHAVSAHFAEVPAAAVTTPWRSLQISGLVFHHAASRRTAPALDELAFTLDRGKRYALIGGSGSGKSTLLRVLSGLYLPERLQLMVDRGAPAASARDAVQWLRATATLIPQDAEVFEGSLAENLSLCESVQGVPDPALYAAALQQSCASDFVAVDAAGLEMQVAERGANWSGGQRQRVSLARGILAAQGSGLLLLDEPTASLDPATERRVYDNLFATFAQACIVSSVHRLNLLERFDEVLVMEAGRLLDRGSVAELLQRSTAFRTLMAAQQLTEG